MKIDGQREFDLLKKIGFIRTAGTSEEYLAANMLKEEVEAMGLKASLEAFEIEDAEIHKAELEVLEPYNKKYTITAYKCCENADGLVADFIYVEDAEAVNLADAKGKIVLVNGYMRVPLYRKLIEAGVAGFITMSGTLLDKEEETDLFTRTIRKTLRAFGNVPGANIRISDAFDLVAKKASKVKLTIKNEQISLISHNVVTEIKGTKYPEEIIAFGAHYDSVPFSTGVYDNGAGSVVNMEVLRYFAENPPIRTVKFVWFGAEEIGLCGSHAYVSGHKDEIEKTVFMVNTDVGGPVLGRNRCRVTAGDDLVNFTDYFMKTKGYAVSISKGVASSDSTPYVNAGVPAINFNRDGTDGSAFIHCRYDIIDYLSPEGLSGMTEHVLDFSNTMVNAVVFPVKREIPKEIVTEVDNYLFKKELAEVNQ